MVLSALVVRARRPDRAPRRSPTRCGATRRRPRGPRWCRAASCGCASGSGAAAIESGSSGYRLTLSDDELDHRLFERLLERGREALAGDDPARASYLVQEALDLWRGQGPGRPGGVGAGAGGGRAARGPADGRRGAAAWRPRSRAGHAPAVLEQARALVAQAPFRERRWALLATALYQSGRQAEALGAVQAGPRDAGRRARPGPGPRAGRAGGAAAAAGPVADAAGARARSAPSARTGGCCRTAPRTPTRSSAARTTSRRACDGCATPASWRWSGRPGSGKSSLVRAGVVAVADPRRARRSW